METTTTFELVIRLQYAPPGEKNKELIIRRALSPEEARFPVRAAEDWLLKNLNPGSEEPASVRSAGKEEHRAQVIGAIPSSWYKAGGYEVSDTGQNEHLEWRDA